MPLKDMIITWSGLFLFCSVVKKDIMRTSVRRDILHFSVILLHILIHLHRLKFWHFAWYIQEEFRLLNEEQEWVL